MAARKNTSRKRNKKQTKKKQDSQSFLKDEIIILSALAASILLLISNFGIGGFVGDAVSSVLFGLFGTIAYIIPILLFTGIAFVISNKGNSIAYIKTVAGVGFTWMVCTLFQLIMNEYTAGTGLFSYYKISSMHKDGGGLFWGNCRFCALSGNRCHRYIRRCSDSLHYLSCHHYREVIYTQRKKRQ